MAEGWNHFRLNCRLSNREACRGTSNMSRRNGEIPRRSVGHPMRERGTMNTSQIPCKYFQRGACAFGEQCRYMHSDLPDSRVTMNKDLPINTTAIDLNYSDGPAASTSTSSSPTTFRHSSKRITSLRKQGTSADSGIDEDASESWVNAPEFIPSGAVAPEVKQPKSYAEAVNPHTTETGPIEIEPGAENKLCPYMELSGTCEYQSLCPYVHGDMCEFCGKPCLHPTDEEQRKQHHNECIKQHELDMELSFAIARSKDKVCGVCMEVIMEKSPGEQRFGILPNCNHCFCLSCIRKWRQAKQFENKIIRACPECRVTSDFVCPSIYWVDTKEEKEKLIREYKGAMSTKNCKYFKSGGGKCPFGNKCFYLHAYPDGTKADVGPPPRQRRQNADGDIEVLQQIILWDFLEERDNRLVMLDELEDFVAFFSDSDESDWSEYDLFYD